MSLLIRELTEDVEQITEINEESNQKQYIIKGIIMEGEIRNRNGRIYPKAILEAEVNRYVTENVYKKRAYGELNHPTTGPTINLDRVSHLFTELRMDNNNAVGTAKILDTPMGKIVKALIDEGASLGISSRGMGSLKKGRDGAMEVQNDFKLSTAGDIVADPSAPNAFVEGIVEGRSWVYDLAASEWIENPDSVHEAIEDIIETAKYSKKELEEKALQKFTKFINSL